MIRYNSLDSTVKVPRQQKKVRRQTLVGVGNNWLSPHLAAQYSRGVCLALRSWPVTEPVPAPLQRYVNPLDFL